MFLRKKKNSANSKTSIQLVDGSRVDGKVRHKIVRHIGTADDEIQLKKLLELGSKIKDLFETDADPDQITTLHEKELSKIKNSSPSILNCKKISSQIKGIHDVYGSILSNFNLKPVFDFNSTYYKVFFDIVMAKIADPSSKRMAAKTLEEDFGISHKLHTIYRMMDKIDDAAIENMQKCIAQHNKQLLGGVVSILFYDVTTIYFESFTSDDLKALGYSKDNKFNQPQIVLTMLVTDKGLPLGYQLFPGNTYEGNTLLTALEKWQKAYPGSDFVLVADSGMLNNNNLTTLEDKGINYIVCSRIKNLPKATQAELLSIKQSKESNTDFFYSMELNKRRLILSYKISRAKKDKFDREKAIDRLNSKLSKSKNPSSLISNYGYKKFISIDGESNIKLNEEKINESERWDGLHGLITNMKDISPEQAYRCYKDLWQIEDAFRIQKSDLKIRPIFHWTERRVTAHIAISYIAYACYKIAEFIINKENETNLSHREIKRCLYKYKINIFKDKNSDNYYAVPEPVTDALEMIYKTFELQLEIDCYKYGFKAAS